MLVNSFPRHPEDVLLPEHAVQSCRWTQSITWHWGEGGYHAGTTLNIQFFDHEESFHSSTNMRALSKIIDNAVEE